MNPITTWSFSIDGLGQLQVWTNEFQFAGGLVTVAISSNAADGFQIFDLGDGNIALMNEVQGSDGNNYPLYWSARFPMAAGENSPGMLIWFAFGNDGGDYSSDAIGSSQTFKLINKGNGNVALQATAGAFPNQYIAGQSGGWYQQSGWDLGTGSLVSSSSETELTISGDQLPILQITNSGYKLDLSGRSLAGLSLADADMRECNLQGADLSGVSSLSGADFSSANLGSANLDGQDLGSANWSQADFSGADLRGVASAAGAQMPGANLGTVNLSKVSLTKAALAGAMLQGATLDGADLSAADLSGANLTGASLAGTDFTGANLQGTIFDNTDLSTALFDSNPQFTRATTGRTTFKGATVPFALLGSDWSYLDLSDATITGIPATIANLVADQALLPDDLDLRNAVLCGASMQGTRMYGIQLQNANLDSANLRGALLKSANLTGANLSMVNLDSAWLISEQTGDVAQAAARNQLSAAVAPDSFMFNTVLDGAHCDGVDFSGAFFVTASAISSSQQASAVGASMNFTKFSGATVVLAVFNGAQLSASDFSNAVLTGSSFQDNGPQATELNPSSDNTHTPASVFRADLSGANFTGANMDGLDMREAIVATAPGNFEQVFSGFGKQVVPVSFSYGATVLGDTTSNTTCPDGSSGPCSI